MQNSGWLKCREDLVFMTILSLFIISSIGIPMVRYAIYLLPFFAFLIWLGSGRITINFDRNIMPFVLLLVLAILVSYDMDSNWAKKTYFIAVYVSVFILFDMSKSNFDVRILSVVTILLFLYSEIVGGPDLKSTTGDTSLIESRSRFESTYGFTLGLLALYFLIRKQYLWFAINVVFTVLAFKRIVLVALVLSIVAVLIPNRTKKLVLSPSVLTAIILIVLALFIEVALGTYDKLISAYFNVSANQLLMGRQELWSLIINKIDFNYYDFLLFGVGHSNVTSILQDVYHGRDILFHSDLLLVLFEDGIIFLVLFVYSLLAQKTISERYLSIFLCLSLLTDNILIYQHVMIPYLLLLAAIRRDESRDEKSLNKSP